MRYVKLVITSARCFPKTLGLETFNIHLPTQNRSNLHPIWHNSCIHKHLETLKDSISLLRATHARLFVFIITPFTDFQVNHCQVHFRRRATKKPQLSSTREFKFQISSQSRHFHPQAASHDIHHEHLLFQFKLRGTMEPKCVTANLSVLSLTRATQLSHPIMYATNGDGSTQLLAARHNPVHNFVS